MSSYRVVRAYPQSADKVWRALTDPELIRQWTSAGRGGVPDRFEPVRGTHFRYMAKPIPPFWDGIVECEVLEVDAPRRLRYTWADARDANPSVVTCTVEPTATGSRLTWDHTDFTGMGGWMMSKLLGRVRRAMLDDQVNGLPAVLKRLDGGAPR